MLRRFLVAATLLAASLAFTPSALAYAASDDQITTQANGVPRELVNPMLADATPAVAPALAPTVTVIEPATNQNAFGYLIDLAFVAFGGLVVIFAPKLWMAVFHSAPPPGALDAILKIIDNGFDLAAVEVKKLVPTTPGATFDFHNETLNFVENFVLQFAKPEQMKALGLTAASLRTWLAAEFAPAT